MALTTIEQGLSFVQYEADGTTPNFPVTFDYLQQADVKVFIGNTEVFYTWLNAAEVTPNTLPSAGDIVTVRRFTTNTERLVDFQDGGQVSERDLDKDSNQLFFLTQESNDTAAFNLTTDPLLQVVDFRGNRGINLAAPVDPTDAINKQYIDDIESDVAAAVSTANAASAAAADAAAAALAIEGIAQAAEDKVDLHLTDETAHDAAFIVNTPAGEVSATDVQGAINELDTEKQSRSEKGAPDGYASLDATGKVPAVQLPSFVDDVEEYADLATFPVTGESGKIYVALDTSKAYRWSGTVYTEISPSEVNSVNGQTGIVVLDKTDVGLDQVDNTSDATKNAAVANLTNKALISPSRLDPKKDTLANLLDYASLTGMNGELVYSTDTKEFFVITDGDLVAAGGGGVDGDSLLINPNFEGREEEWVCTDATGAIVESTIPYGNNTKMFQMTVTTAGGKCDFVVPSSNKMEGLLFKIGALYQTELTDVEYCTLVDGNEDNCIPLPAVSSLATDPFKEALRTQSQAGATSVGIRVKTTASTSGVVNFDKLKAVIGELNTGSAISCSGDLDCENVFSAKVSAAGVVSEESGGDWINGNAVITSTSVYTLNLNNMPITAPLNCTATIITNSSAGTQEVKMWTQPTVSQLQFATYAANTTTSFAFNPFPFHIICQKAAPDFKTITQQGVVNVGTSNAMELVVSSESVTTNQTVGAATVTVDFPDVHRSRGITWNTTTDEGTFLESGKVRLSANIIASNGAQTGVSWQIFPEIDTGSGFAIPADLKPVTYVTTSTVAAIIIPNAEFTFRVQAGDKIRLRASSNGANSILLGDDALRFQTMSIDSVVDQQTIAASMIDRKIYDGNEYLAGEIAVVGGVEKTVHRRCYNLASNISTSGTAITPAPPAGLKPIGAIGRGGGVWVVEHFSRASTGGQESIVLYQDTTGVLSVTLISSEILSAGTNFCFKYYK